MKNRVTEILGIRYPIFQGVIGGKQTRLVAAVSAAGGLGTIHGLSAIGGGKEAVRDQIQEIRSTTDNPFSINIPINIPLITQPKVEQLIEVVIESGMKVVETSAGSPKVYTQRLHEAGIKVIHKVATVAHALAAAQAGVDIIVATGIEGAGYQSREEVTTFCLIPQIIDALQGKIPVVAAGGIGDARGLVAALALGAEGVLMGTRFLTSVEFETRPGIDKELFLQATDTSTEIAGRGTRNPTRRWTEAFLNEQRTGDTQRQGGLAGQVAGLIKEIRSVEEIIHQMVDEADKELARVSQQIAPSH